MSALLAIDGDILLYSCGFANETQPLSFAKHAMKLQIEKICASCCVNPEDMLLVFSGPENFRDKVATMQPYKGNRKNVTKPIHYDDLKSWAIARYAPVVSEDEEADDVLGKLLAQGHVDTIATIDKDLNMIPGTHYNWKHDSVTEVTEEQGINFFIEQLISGDATDNIPGLFRCTGMKGSQKIKDRCTSKALPGEKYMEVVKVYAEGLCEQYKKTHGQDELHHVVLNELESEAARMVNEIGELLWIRRDNKPYSEHMLKWLTDWHDAQQEGYGNEKESS